MRPVRRRHLWWESLSRALGRSRLRRVLAAYLGFIVCEHAHWIAVLIWAFDVSGVRGAGAIAAAQLVPATLLATPMTTLLGRLPRTRALTVGYLAQACAFCVVGVAILASTPGWLVVAASVVMAVAVTLTRPIHYATLPEISETAGDLTASTAASGSVEAVATLLGPLLCAVVIGFAGPGGVLVVTAVVSGVGAVLTATMTSDAPTGETTDEADPGETPTGGQSVPPARVRGALRAVVADPAARTLVGLTSTLYLLVGMVDIMLVVLALQLLGMGDSGPGVLTAAMGLGALVGASLTFVLVGRERLAPLLVAAGCVAGFSFAVTGNAGTPAVAVALVALTGAGRLFFEVTARTFEQRLLPDRLLVALFGVQEAVMMAGMALGSVLAPLLVELWGPRGAFAGGALLPLLALLAWRRLREYDDSTAVPMDVLALLHRVPILTVLAPRVVERLACESEPLTVPEGQAVVTEGEPGDRFYVVAGGRVAVSHDGQVVRELGEGGWFGELALLRAVPRTATVTAVTEVSLYSLGRDAFLSAVSGASRAVVVASEHARRHYR